jgi:hypothetical protein
MEKNNHFCRRSFLKKGFVATAGLSLLGTGIKAIASPEDEWRWIAFCTQACNTCPTYQSGGCWSCKSAQGLQGSCPVKRCAIDVKKVPTCAHCADLETCDKYDDNPELRTQAMELRDSLSVSSLRDADKNYSIRVYSSPSNNGIRIMNPETHEANYTLIDLSGKICKQGEIHSSSQLINVSDIRQGTYIIKLTDKGNLILSQKILIQ